MRVDFVNSLSPILTRDSSQVFISGDLGYNAFERLAAELGRRFLNAGVAEQNMVGVAAGMALQGLKPWVYSIAPFATYRCLEQIRNDVCLHGLPVRVVGNGGGYTYGIMGSTHHAMEDLGVLKPLPNMTLYFPCTGDHVKSAVEQVSNLGGPAYLRLSISGFPATLPFQSQNPKTLTRRYSQEGSITLIGVGHAAQIAMSTIQKENVGVDFFGLAKFPLDLESDSELLDSVNRTGKVLVVEEHYLAGSIAESLRLALPTSIFFQALTPSYFPGQKYGSPAFHLRQGGLSPETVLQSIRKIQDL